MSLETVPNQKSLVKGEVWTLESNQITSTSLPEGAVTSNHFQIEPVIQTKGLKNSWGRT
jgi:hypothetical protein